MIGRTQAKIIVRFTHAGMHNWPRAPHHRDYLASVHRHLFKVEVACWVTHDNREIEFHDLHDFAKGEFARGFTQEDAVGYDKAMARSCEMMAAELGAALVEKHQRVFEVTVWEDGEFGSQVTSHIETGTGVQKEKARD